MVIGWFTRTALLSTATVKGRTRRDQVLAKIGPYASAGDQPQTIFINDPVAQVNYILEPASRIARKMTMPNVIMRRTPDNRSDERMKTEPGTLTAADREKLEVTMQAATTISGVATGIGSGGAAFSIQGGDTLSKKANKESLGKQMIEGVEAEGTRDNRSRSKRARSETTGRSPSSQKRGSHRSFRQ
jgi:hypothetical protein